MDDLPAIGSAGGYNAFGGVCVEAVDIAISCLNKDSAKGIHYELSVMERSMEM